MISYKFTECEPTIENFWENVRTVDKYHNLQYMSGLLIGYFKFEQNKDKTPKELELDLREHNLDVGLIADDMKDDMDLKNALKMRKVVLMKLKHFEKNKQIARETINLNHLAKYMLRISCRERQDVIDETLKFTDSFDNNLENLSDAGLIVSTVLQKDIKKISDNDVLFSKNDKDITELLIKGTVKIIVEEVNPEHLFANAIKKYPSASQKIISMLQYGSPVFGLVKDTKLVCNIGLNIFYNNDGKQCIRYLPLNT